MVLFLIALLVWNILSPKNIFKSSQLDECDVGKEIVSGSELSNYNCEGLDNCEWRPLGCTESGMCRSACCPKNLTLSDETRSIYSRCFLLID